MTSEELNYQQQLEKQVRKYESGARYRRNLLLVLGGFALLIGWLKVSQPRCLWVPNYKNPEVVFIRKKLFHPDYVVRCAWQQDEHGMWGWCAKNHQGKWFIFACDDVWQAMNDYPTVLTDDRFPHGANARINE